MAKTHKAARSSVFPRRVEIHEVDGTVLSQPEVKLAKLIVDKLTRVATSSVIHLDQGSTRRLFPKRSRSSR